MTRRIALLTALVVLLCGCGVSTQDRPERVVLPVTPSASKPDDVSDGSVEVQVYFVRGARLEAVTRWASADDPRTVLGALVAGPDRREVLTGLRTAIAPQADPKLTTALDGTVQVDLPPELTGLTGGNQLLAFAQLVWTLTGTPQVRAIRFTAAGSPIEVPTDDGLAGGPVDRDDYSSVSPSPTVRPSVTD
jgi:spore germination protein GerM